MHQTFPVLQCSSWFYHTQTCSPCSPRAPSQTLPDSLIKYLQCFKIPHCFIFILQVFICILNFYKIFGLKHTPNPFHILLSPPPSKTYSSNIPYTPRSSWFCHVYPPPQPPPRLTHQISPVHHGSSWFYHVYPHPSPLPDLLIKYPLCTKVPHGFVIFKLQVLFSILCFYIIFRLKHGLLHSLELNTQVATCR